MAKRVTVLTKTEERVSLAALRLLGYDHCDAVARVANAKRELEDAVRSGLVEMRVVDGKRIFKRADLRKLRPLTPASETLQ